MKRWLTKENKKILQTIDYRLVNMWQRAFSHSGITPREAYTMAMNMPVYINCAEQEETKQ